MASFAGLRLGSRGSSLRPFPLHSFSSTRNSSLLPSRRHLEQAPHLFLARFSSSPSYSLSLSSSSSSSSSPSAAASALSSAIKVPRSEKDEFSGDDTASSSSTPKDRLLARKFPSLTPKEKKDLRAYAHSLGRKIVSQQVGKAGVTETLTKSISDALEAKEILKLKVLDNCPDELDEVIAKIEDATHAQVVGKIGSVLTLYRPSLRKLSEAQKAQGKVVQGRPQQRRTMSSGRRM